MRSGLMRMVPALSAVLVLSAVTANAAQAIEGVHFKVAGVKLTEGQSKEITSQAGTVEVGYGLGLSKCSTAVAPGGKIFGSSVGNSGTGELELEFTNCKGTRKCALSGSFKTEPLTLTLGAAEGAEFTENHGELAALLKPKSGVAVMRWHLPSCPEEAIAGKLAVTIGSGDKIDEELPEAKTVELRMPYPHGDTRFVSVIGGATISESYAGLSGSEGEFYVAGSAMLELASGENWGVFQKH